MGDLQEVQKGLPDIVEGESKQVVSVEKSDAKNLKAKKSVIKKDVPQKKEEKPTDDIKTLLEKNLKMSEIIFEQNKKIKNRLTMMIVGNYVKLLLVIIPLIIAFIYLPPLLAPVLSQYNELLGGGAGETVDFSSILKTLSPQEIIKVQEMLKNAPK